VLGLTQKQVTSRLGRLGIDSTNKSLSSLEHGAGLDVAKLPELAAALDCTVTWLLGLTEDPHRWEPDAMTPSRPPRGPTRAAIAEDAAPPARGPDRPVGATEPAAAAAGGSAPSAPPLTSGHRSGPWILGPLQPEP
jgi:transcriptional regulator with XRE-family HTH domain